MSEIEELVRLDGSKPGRVQVVPPGVSNGVWIIQATYGFADRVLATCAYERDAVALARSLAAAVGPGCHFDHLGSVSPGSGVGGTR